MNEEIKNNVENAEAKDAEAKDVEAEKAREAEEVKKAAKLITDPDETIRHFGKGKFMLAVPIRAGGKDVTELNYDFTKVTGMEYVEALDSDIRNTNAFRVSATQAHTLFAVAAAKVTDGIDATDIKKRMSAQDSVKAVQLATIFFTACNRAGNNRILNE